ncbi:uncharacterized protein KY384_007342 [Bacidia gigantensis]|uniref:uncharacterized protein n=1 Tax=Bacidia gigantensis TaxID=2732470 RepID=UPI001D04C6FB|nr:uncharacterized protein KY384_007342 [Bacidia gigantensis]KAG8528424.1 hypothetical protein KY384_007342 [Bacidia gigantensis]
MATKDSMQTSAGSWALLGSLVSEDAHIVSLLRKAGAVIIGHSNMSEWASVRSKSYSTGYSPRGGQTRNPYDLSSSPFGSSSGSAVAVSTNIVPISFGTETDTSIIGPASINGVVGIKPTVGLTSRHGIIPISKNFDTVGTFGRTVADAVHGLTAIASKDSREIPSEFAATIEEGGFSASLSTQTALRGAQFGLPQKRCWQLVPQGCKHVAQTLFKAIEKAGATIVDVDFPCAEERISSDGSWNWQVIILEPDQSREHGEEAKSEYTVVKADAYNGINEYLSNLKSSQIRSVEDIIAFNEQNTGTGGAFPGDHPAFPTGQMLFFLNVSQDNLHEIAQTKGSEDDTYHAALKHVQSQTRENGIDAALRHKNDDGTVLELDALLLCDRKGAGQQLAAQAGGSSSNLSSTPGLPERGYPIICIPIGVDTAGLPVSLSLQHTAWKGATLIKWASAIEDLVQHVFGGRPQPTYKNCHSKNIPINKPPTD